MDLEGGSYTPTYSSTLVDAADTTVPERPDQELVRAGGRITLRARPTSEDIGAFESPVGGGTASAPVAPTGLRVTILAP